MGSVETSHKMTMATAEMAILVASSHWSAVLHFATVCWSLAEPPEFSLSEP